MRENPETLPSFPPPSLPPLLALGFFLSPFPFLFLILTFFLSALPTLLSQLESTLCWCQASKHTAARLAWGQAPVLTFHVGRSLVGQRLL